MKTIHYFLFFMLFLFSNVVNSQEKMLKIIIQFEDNVELVEVKEMVKTYGGILQNFESKKDLKVIGNIYELKIPQNDRNKIVDSFRKDKRVKFVEEDQLIPGSFIPNDPKFINQWYIKHLKVDSIWDSYTGKDIIVAVLDTGVDSTHPDLNANIIPGWNLLLNNNNTQDTNNHGTWVAGVIAAIANNNIGIAGVSYSVKIMPIVIANENAYAYWSYIATGLIKAADMGAKIANVSYMAYNSSLVENAAKYFMDKGGIVFVSSGNEGLYKTAKPSDYTVVVGAIGTNNVRMSWSNYGLMLDIMAPGDSIITTKRGNLYSTTW